MASICASCSLLCSSCLCSSRRTCCSCCCCCALWCAICCLCSCCCRSMMSISMISDCRGRIGGGPSPKPWECLTCMEWGSGGAAPNPKALSEFAKTAPRGWNSCQCLSLMGRSWVKYLASCHCRMLAVSYGPWTVF